MIKISSLIFLSGGLDSSFACLKLLKENPNNHYLIVHCNMKNKEDRFLQEAIATKKVIELMKNHNKLSNFTFFECGFDYGTIPHIIQDIELWGFLMGMICRSNTYDIETITICRSKYDETLPGYESRSKRRYEILRATLGRDIEFIYPITHLDREDMIDELAKTESGKLYLKATHFCRKPQNGYSCKCCATCLNTFPHLQKHNIEHN